VLLNSVGVGSRTGGTVATWLVWIETSGVVTGEISGCTPLVGVEQLGSSKGREMKHNHKENCP
jgi:hypothetical protein